MYSNPHVHVGSNPAQGFDNNGNHVMMEGGTGSDVRVGLFFIRGGRQEMTDSPGQRRICGNTR